MPKVVVLTGGGIKGAVTAARYAAENQLCLVHVQYGQPAARRQASAVGALADAWSGAQVLTLRLPHVMELDGVVSAQTAPRVALQSGPNHEQSIPPASCLRGLTPVLLSLGIQCAMRVGASVVATGLSRFCEAEHLGLATEESMPGGRHELVHVFDMLAESLSRSSPRMRVEAPLMELTLPDIIRLGTRFNVALANTWSCALEREQACGECDGCASRAGAFVDVGRVDPLMSARPLQDVAR